MPHKLNLSYEDSNPVIQKFTKKLMNPILQRLFFLVKLPSAFFWGLKIYKITKESAEVKLRYSWRTQNPFKSIYFAAQAAAAEISTGVLVMRAIQGRGKISMLVVNMDCNFSKKATSTVTFSCNAGAKVIAAVQQTIETGESQTIVLETIGTQLGKGGEKEEVSSFRFTWSLKKVQKKP